MSGIAEFQIFKQPLNGSGPETTVPVASVDASELGIQADSSSLTAMHLEATQPESEETQISTAGADRRVTSTVSDAWGLLRRQSPDREEFELIHRIKDFKRDTFSIGRSSKCDITVSDCWVSTTHCLVYCDYTQPKMRVFIEDSSANGTYINNSLTRLRKGERVELRGGDEIFLLNPRKPENAVKTHTSFVFINLRERLMAFREISLAPSYATSIVPNSTGARLAASTAVVPPPSGDILQGHPQSASQHTQPSQLSSQASQRSQSSASMVRHIEEKYIIGDQIGSGMSGQVYICINKQTQEQCAVKIIDTRKFSLNAGLSVADLREEAELMQQFNHPNIIRVLDTFQTCSMIYIVMELLRGGDLFDRIIEKERYSEESARQLMIQVLSAVQYLHERQIIHRDLKPENILLVSSKSDVEVKVTDFGLAKKANREGLKTFCGTPQYFAPEVLQRKNNGSGSAGRYGTAVDMWSLGVILYILLSGTFPFNDDEEILRAQYSLSGMEWTGVSPGAKHLIRSLMALRVDQRYTVQQALRHPWICGIAYPPPVSLGPGLRTGQERGAALQTIGASDAPGVEEEKAGADDARNAGVADMNGNKDTSAKQTVITTTAANAVGPASALARVKSTAAGSTAQATAAPTKKRQASTAAGNTSISRQTSTAKRANLRRGGSLFAPLELKFKSSMEYVTTTTALGARATSLLPDASAVGGTKSEGAVGCSSIPVARSASVTAAGAGSKGALANALSAARVPKTSTSLAPIFVNPRASAVSQPPLAPAPAGAQGGTTAPKQPRIEMDLAFPSASSGGTITPRAVHPPARTTSGSHGTGSPRGSSRSSSPAQLPIDLTHCSHSSTVQLPSPNPAIVHLSVTNAITCLDGLLQPLVQYCDRLVSSGVSTPSTRAPSTDASSVGVSLPPRPAFKRATSYDDKSSYLPLTTAAGTATPVSAAGASVPSYSAARQALPGMATVAGSGLSALLSPLVINSQPGSAGGASIGCASGERNEYDRDPYDDVIEDYSSDDGDNCNNKPDSGKRRGKSARKRQSRQGGGGSGVSPIAPSAAPKPSCLKKESPYGAPLLATPASAATAVSSADTDGGSGGDAGGILRPRRHKRSVSFSDTLCVLAGDHEGDGTSNPSPLKVVTDRAMECAAVPVVTPTGAEGASQLRDGVNNLDRELTASHTKTPTVCKDTRTGTDSVMVGRDATDRESSSGAAVVTAKKIIGIKRTQSSLEQAWKRACVSSCRPASSSSGTDPAVGSGGKEGPLALAEGVPAGVRQDENVVNTDAGLVIAQSDGGGDRTAPATLLGASKKSRAPMRSLSELFRSHAPSR